MGRYSGAIKGLVPAIEGLDLSEHSVKRPGHCAKYHVVSDKFKVAIVDVNFVYVKDASHLPQNCGACGFHAVRDPNGIDIVRVDAVLVDQAIGVAACKLPKTRNVGTIRGELPRSVSICQSHRRKWITLYTTWPLFSSLVLKQSVSPEISRMTVFKHVFSTMPTSRSFGKSEPNCSRTSIRDRNLD